MLSLNPTLDTQFATFADTVLEEPILSDREQAVALLAVALTLEDADAVRQAILSAKQADLSNEEIGYVSAVVLALRGQKLNRLAQGGASSGQSSCCS